MYNEIFFNLQILRILTYKSLLEDSCHLVLDLYVIKTKNGNYCLESYPF